MMSNLDSLFFAILFLVALSHLVSVIAKYKLNIFMEYFLAVTGHGCLAYWSLVNILKPRIDLYFGRDFDLALWSVSLLVVPAITLAGTALGHNRKRRVASRIPLIAFLLGMYLKTTWFVIMFAAFSLLFNFMMIKDHPKSHLYQYRQFVWMAVFLVPILVGLGLGFIWDLNSFRFIIIIGLLIPYYFYSRYLNAFTFGYFFKKKLL